MLIGLLILVLGLAIGIPIYAVMLASGLYILVFELQIDPAMLVSGLFESINSFTLASVSFFLLAGSLMNHTSMSQRMVDAIHSLIGHRRGGVALTTILANEVFGAISGSSAAAVGTVGRVLLPTLSQQHGRPFALGLVTSAGALSVIMPPSIPMILYATVANVSTGRLFLAGVVPALITGLALWGCIAWNSRHLPKSTGRVVWSEARRLLLRASLVLALPVVILGGIYTGLFTPTEAAVVSVGYALLLGGLLYREIRLRELSEAMQDAIRLASQIFIVIAASSVFSQALTLAQIPQKLAALTAALSPATFLLMVNGILLLAGMFFDAPSAILVLTPLLKPAATALGIDLIHLGVLITLNIAIGMFTPPFGLNLFVSQSVFNASTREIVGGLTPFWFWYLLALAIVTYFPSLYMWLPRLI